MIPSLIRLFVFIIILTLTLHVDVMTTIRVASINSVVLLNQEEIQLL